MISHELSMIQLNAPRSAELASHIEAFLSVGGTIQELPGFQRTKDRPPCTYPPDFSTQKNMNAKEGRISRVRSMAKTMTAQEICDAEGLSRGELRGLQKRYGFTCKSVDRTGKAPPNKMKPEEEAIILTKIHEAAAEGLSQRACCAKHGFSDTVLRRLERDYGFTYPRH
ncbi:hypothetical protein [Pseudomonas chlororaphis]|uniref:hypothetical protein n=1 Tax=Pseudomonas chlororaphis TaxID=587753 RepID=UPI0015DF72BA|nr:hypothetical protein [Pseudomonas chlororaphis]QLL11737.1 hypothetical protein H0I86_22290 [Pseudomonas chlororaphis subsp. aurantiaca]